MAGHIAFSKEEQKRLERARVLVSAGDFKLSTAQFIHHATMQAVDEVLGANNTAYLREMNRHA